MRGKKKTYLIDGNELTIQQISELFGISYTAVYNGVIKKGYRGDTLKKWLQNTDNRNTHSKDNKLWCHSYCLKCKYRKPIVTSAKPNNNWDNTYCSCYPDTGITPVRGTVKCSGFRSKRNGR